MKTFAILLTIIYSVLFSADITITTSTDSLFVGGTGIISITVSNLDNPGAVPVFSEMLDESESYSLIHKSLNKNSIEYLVQFWDDGGIAIPPVTVDIMHNHQIIDEISTDTIFVEVYSNLSADTQVIRDIKPLREMQLISTSQLVIYILLVLLGIGATMYLWMKKRRAIIPEGIPESYQVSPLLECIKEIESATIPDKITQKSTEIFYLDLTRVCRDFLNKLFYVKATEMTSSELDKYFHTSGIDEDILVKWNTIIQTADFAKYGGQIPEINQFNEDKQQFIELMKSFQKIKDTLETYPK